MSKSSIRELPEYLRQWDGRPSQFHEHRLAYLAPAPYPPDKTPRAQKTGRTTRPPKAAASDFDDSARQRLMAESDEPELVTGEDVAAILCIAARAHDGGGRLLEQLQDETHVLLRRANAAREKAETRRSEGAGTATESATGADDPADDDPVNAPQQAAEEPEAAPSAAADEQLQPTKPRREAAPRTRPRPVKTNPDGSIDFMPGIDSNVRYNLGKSKIPSARVMSLPWNMALLPEAEQEKLKRRQLSVQASKERRSLVSEEDDARASVLRESRGLWKEIRLAEQEERDALVHKARRNAKAASRSNANASGDEDSPPPCGAESEVQDEPSTGDPGPTDGQRPADGASEGEGDEADVRQAQVDEETPNQQDSQDASPAPSAPPPVNPEAGDVAAES